MLSTAKRLTTFEHPYQKDLIATLKPVQSILKLGFCFRVKNNTEAELIMEYLNSMFLVPSIAYQLVLTKVHHHRKEMVTIRKMIGEMETALSVLNFRLVNPDYCIPNLSGNKIHFEATNLYHLLVDNPVKNPVSWSKNTLVTESNASGKSTYVKAIAVNTMLAQTIHTVMADQCQLSYGHIYSSMAVNDDLLANESYFIAGIKSIKRVLDRVMRYEPCYCFIDEILRGTNTVERIAASASIVNWLASYPSLAFVATHDNELTTILEKSCENLHFSEVVTQKEGISFDYRVKNGSAKSRNALRLL